MSCGVEAVFQMPCAPPFIDMESYFLHTLEHFPGKQDMFDRFKHQYQNEDSNCRSYIMNNIKGFNVNRCDRTYAVDTQCTTTSTTTTTTTTTSTQTPTSAATVRHTSVITNGKTTGTKTGTSKYDDQTSPWPATGKSTLAPQSAHSSTPVREPVTLGSTTNHVGDMTHDKENILPSLEPSITPKEVVGPIAEDKTTIYVCVGAAVLLLIVIAALVLICRYVLNFNIHLLPY